MSERADAHIHLFEKGFHGSFTGRPGVEIDEVALYASLQKDHSVTQALVVGYEGEEWARGNNDYIARVSEEQNWVRPTAFVHLDAPPDVMQLEALRRQRFVGVSLYVYGEASVEAVRRFNDDLWSWIEQHRWIVSLNSKGADLLGWVPILDRHHDLRLVVSHLGLPPRVAEAPKQHVARAAVDHAANLARFPGAHVKLSGFYAVSDPGHEYPHKATWPYVEALLESFGSQRLLWGSDFTPSLDCVTFPQTFGLFCGMPFLKKADRDRIEGANLLRLLKQVKTGEANSE